MQLHEDFDMYVNYLEGIAIISKKGNVLRASLEGLWAYYLKRLRSVHMLDFKYPQGQNLLIKDINKCIDNLFKDSGNKPTVIKSAFERYASKKVSEINVTEFEDPVEAKYKPTKTVAIINPIERPLWYYINTPGYEFGAIIELCKKLYNEDPHIELKNDGL